MKIIRVLVMEGDMEWLDNTLAVGQVAPEAPFILAEDLAQNGKPLCSIREVGRYIAGDTRPAITITARQIELALLDALI